MHGTSRVLRQQELLGELKNFQISAAGSRHLRSANLEWREAIVSTFAVTGKMPPKGTGSGAFGVTA